MLPPGRARLATIPASTGLVADRHDDRHRAGRTLRRLRHLIADRYDHIDLATDQLRHDLAEALEPALRRPALQDQVAALDVARGRASHARRL